MRYLRQSTAVAIGIGPFLDATDGVTPETGLAITAADVRLKKGNSPWVAANDANDATHEENGWYEKELNITDTNLVGHLLLAVHEAGALPVWHEFTVLEEVVYDALFGINATGDLTGVWTSAARTLTAGTNIVLAKGVGVTGFNDPTVGQIADEVQTRTITGVTTVNGLASNAVTAAALAADAVAEIQSGLATASALATTDGKVDAILEDTGTTLPATLATIAGYIDTEIAEILAAVADLPTAHENADALLGRNIAGGSSSGRLVMDALRRLRNRVAIVAGTATVYQEDDTTPAWTAAVTRTAGDPVSEVNPT